VSYIPRVVDAQVAELLSVTGVILIEGPRAVGKTETAKRFTKSSAHLDTDESARALAAMGSDLVLKGETPRLIDEWQVESKVWNLIKREVDTRKLKGQFILTGSATPADAITRNTGAGRVSRIQMRPMSLFETGHSTGAVSISSLFSGNIPSASDSGMSLSTIIERICIGGWPLFAYETVDIARMAMQSYLTEISGMDVQQVSGVSHDPVRVMNVLRSLARNVGTKTSILTIAKDAGGSAGSLDPLVVTNYLNALARLMVTEDLPSWAPHLRSKARVRSAPTRFFVDPSLAVAAIQASPTSLLNDLNAVGFLFENLVVRDLRIYTQALNGKLSQYRDSNKLEVDVIIEAFDGKWAAIEVKLGLNQIDEAAKTLIEFAGKVDTTKCGKPEFLAVVTSTGYAYMREDGVYVLPIGLLKP